MPYFGFALTAAGHHRAGWAETSADPRSLFTGQHYVSLAQLAERGRFDFLTIADSFAPVEGVGGQLDALLVAARIGPATDHIGLLPTVTTTHTEPFHVSKSVATLDYVSNGRAGWHADVSRTAAEAAHFGRRPAESSVDCGLRPATRSTWCAGCGTAGRTAPRSGTRRPDVSSTGTSCITSISPASSFPSAARRSPRAHRRASHWCPYGWTIPRRCRLPRSGPISCTARPGNWPRQPTFASGYGPRWPPLAAIRTRWPFLVDVATTVAGSEPEAVALQERLDLRASSSTSCLTFVGSGAGLVDLIEQWHDVVDGFTLSAAVLPQGLEAIVDHAVPILTDRGLLPAAYASGSLRDRFFGLPRPASRYAA